MNQYINDLYYILKPVMPRSLQLYMRRRYIRYQQKKYQKIWPIDEKAATHPLDWQGWPQGKRFALVLTHDVDVGKGHDRCRDLMKLESDLGFRSSFNFVPLRYAVSSDLRDALLKEGFEVGVHGLYHDGKYYTSKAQFLDRAEKINHYLKEWQAVGYRAPAMHHRLNWFHHLDIEYDASTFDTDPFEPHAVGAGTVFPFLVINNFTRTGYVELPYTLPQDFTLFVLMRQKNVDTWKTKLRWVAEHGGMVLMNTHPDYMRFGKTRPGNEEYPAAYYEEFLKHVKEEYADQYWHVLPRDMAGFWRSRYSLDRYQYQESKYPYYNALVSGRRMPNRLRSDADSEKQP
jgi:hypothetical protein